MPKLLELLLSAVAMSGETQSHTAASCQSFPDAFLTFDAKSQVARQGATLSVAPVYRLRGPYGWNSVPVKCLSDWTVLPIRAATLSKDRSKLLIAKDAKPGIDITLSARFGAFTAVSVFRVVGRDEAVLAGKYSQSAASGCGDSRSVGELLFDERGNFSVTYQPFETYVDYSGTYQWMPKTGALRLFSPRDAKTPMKEGIARFEKSKLVLEGILLDWQKSQAPRGAHEADCRLEF